GRGTFDTAQKMGNVGRPTMHGGTAQTYHTMAPARMFGGLGFRADSSSRTPHTRPAHRENARSCAKRSLRLARLRAPRTRLRTHVFSRVYGTPSTTKPLLGRADRPSLPVLAPSPLRKRVGVGGCGPSVSGRLVAEQTPVPGGKKGRNGPSCKT